MCIYRGAANVQYSNHAVEQKLGLMCIQDYLGHIFIMILASMCTDYSDDDQGGMAAALIDGDCGFDAMETHFEGIFQAGGHQAEGGGAWAGTDLYQGVEPMG